MWFWALLEGTTAARWSPEEDQQLTLTWVGSIFNFWLISTSHAGPWGKTLSSNTHGTYSTPSMHKNLLFKSFFTRKHVSTFSWFSFWALLAAVMHSFTFSIDFFPAGSGIQTSSSLTAAHSHLISRGVVLWDPAALMYSDETDRVTWSIGELQHQLSPNFWSPSILF